eukprot:5071570-Amphidinium_carterae.2
MHGMTDMLLLEVAISSLLTLFCLMGVPGSTWQDQHKTTAQDGTKPNPHNLWWAGGRKSKSRLRNYKMWGPYPPTTLNGAETRSKESYVYDSATIT